MNDKEFGKDTKIIPPVKEEVWKFDQEPGRRRCLRKNTCQHERKVRDCADDLVYSAFSLRGRRDVFRLELPEEILSNVKHDLTNSRRVVPVMAVL